MLRHTTIALIALTVCSTIGVHRCSARIIEDWPYEKLFERAEVVVIASAKMVRDAPRDPNDKPEEYLLGQITSFEVRSVLKGNRELKKLTLFHYKLKKGTKLFNGPLLVSFATKEFELRRRGTGVVVVKPQYLLFLKKRTDGRYMCVSGQFDPDLSVREIFPVLPSFLKTPR